MERVSSLPHIDHLTQHIRVSLGVPADGRAGAVDVGVLLGSGSGLASAWEDGGGAEDQAAGGAYQGRH